jgi:hypothetical protein
MHLEIKALRFFLATMLLTISFNSNAEIKSASIDFYITSYHFDDNGGKGYNESNYGLGLNWKVYEVNEKHHFYLNTGAFNNSHKDLAYWVGGRYVWDFNKYLDIGVNGKHWRTLNNTYEERIIVFYPEVGIKFNEEFKLNAILRLSGFVFYFEYNF